MFGAIAGGIASALAGGAMSKLFGGGQKAASGGIQGDVLATDNNTVGFFFSSRRRPTKSTCDWSSDVCSSDLQSTTACRIRLRYPYAATVQQTAYRADAASAATVAGKPFRTTTER